MEETVASSQKLVLPPPIVESQAYLDEIEDWVPGEIEVDDHGRLFKKYLRYEGFLDFLSRGFDIWATKVIPRQLLTHHLDIGKAKAYFENVVLDRPKLVVSKETKILWPKVCRDTELDYSGALYADLVLYVDEKAVERIEKVFLGMIPIMLGSEYDNLKGLSKTELLSKGEDPYDPFHYFIVKGTEKVLLLDEKISAMKILIFENSSRDTSPGIYLANMTNETMRGSNVVSIVMLSNSILHLRLSLLGKDNTLNLLTVFKLMGIEDPDEILKFIVSFTKPEWSRRVLEKLNRTYLEFRELGDPVEYITKIKSIPRKPYNERKADILTMFREELFPQVKPIPTEDKRKLSMLAQMTVRLLEFMAGFRPLDDRDSWVNKRLDAANESMRQLFQTAYNDLMRTLQKEITTKNLADLGIISQKVNGKIITDAFHTSFSSNNWGNGYYRPKNIVDMLKRDNLLEAYSHLSKVRVRGNEKSHGAHSRMVQPTACGFVCPAETPERGPCGVTKNLSITASLTARDPETDILIYEIVNSYISSEKTELNMAKCWFNGIFLGWCPGIMLKEKIVNARRKREIPLHTSVILDRDDTLTISTITSRLSRPLLIVNPESHRLVIDEKDLWGASFDTLIAEEVVEYLDPAEQEFALIAQTIWQLDERIKIYTNVYNDLARAYAKKAVILGEQYLPPEITGRFTEEEFKGFMKEVEEVSTLEAAEDEISNNRNLLSKIAGRRWFTHCDLEPLAQWGYSTSIIPLANHNLAPRLTFEAKMGTQALMTYHSQQLYRFDASMKSLAFPTQSYFETHVSEELGFADLGRGPLPSVIAVLTYWGWNQEDAFIINEHALELGHFRYIAEFSVRAIEKSEKEEEEIIKRPVLPRQNPEYSYENLDENGIARPGSVVKPRDALIGMVRRNKVTGEEKNITIFMPENKSGIIDAVYISGEKRKRIVSVRVRDTRIPQKGSKFALRPSQKGTAGLVMAAKDMPFNAQGISPDIIINPLAFPSRMTVGTILEIIISKALAVRAARWNAASFRSFDINLFAEQLERFGYHRYGEETLYSGITGQKMKASVYMGVALVQRLKHDVEDKIQSRGKTHIDPRTRQPPRGRKRGGGLRFGEQETWAMISHGAAYTLKERLCEASDASPIIFCTVCGDEAIINHVDKNYECRLCGAKGIDNFARGTLPYIQKHLNDILHGANIGIRYRLRKVEE